MSTNSGLPNNFGQAFDLSSLRKPIVEINPADLGIVVSQANLMQEILPISNATAVILVCWSPRSTQSQSLLPLLANLHASDSANLADAPWVYASLDVDAEPEVAQALQVKAVPFALALLGEQLVPLFESVPPLQQIRAVIDKVLMLAAERGIGKKSEAVIEEQLEAEEEQAMTALENGDYDGARAAYKAWLNRSPANSVATIGLAQVELLARVNGIDFGDTLARGAIESTDISLQIRCADIEVALGDYESAFNRLIAVVKGTDGDERKAVREHLVGLFLLIDPTDPLLIDARKRLASALF